MAFTYFIPKFKTQEGQDATTFKIWDESTWSGEQDLCTEAKLQLSFYDTMGQLIDAQEYKLIDGADRTRFEEYLSSDGHIISIGSVLPASERFTDGYYMIMVTYDDGTYTEVQKPKYVDHQAFLAKLRCMSRKMPEEVVKWPDYDREKLLDTHVLTLLLDSAEDAADMGKKMKFEKIVRTLNRVFDQYQITGCF